MNAPMPRLGPPTLAPRALAPRALARRAFVLMAPLALAACAGGAPVPGSFPPLNYSYLPKISLKVSTVQVQNNYLPGPGAATMLGLDPETPAAAVAQMVNDRVIPDGTPGAAIVTIENAGIDQVGDNLTGTITIRLDVRSADGRSSGFTEASVTQTETAPDPGSSDGRIRAALYELTKSLMDAANVQFQYQIQHHLGPWLTYSPGAVGLGGSGTAPGYGAAPAYGGVTGGGGTGVGGTGVGGYGVGGYGGGGYGGQGIQSAPLGAPGGGQP